MIIIKLQINAIVLSPFPSCRLSVGVKYSLILKFQIILSMFHIDVPLRWFIIGQDGIG